MEREMQPYGLLLRNLCRTPLLLKSFDPPVELPAARTTTEAIKMRHAEPSDQGSRVLLLRDAPLTLEQREELLRAIRVNTLRVFVTPHVPQGAGAYQLCDEAKFRQFFPLSLFPQEAEVAPEAAPVPARVYEVFEPQVSEDSTVNVPVAPGELVIHEQEDLTTPTTLSPEFPWATLHQPEVLALYKMDALREMAKAFDPPVPAPGGITKVALATSLQEAARAAGLWVG